MKTLPEPIREALRHQPYVFEIRHRCGHTVLDTGPWRRSFDYVWKVAGRNCTRCIADQHALSSTNH